MSRGVKDLRELICVSRLSIVNSDDSDCDGDDEGERCSSTGALNGNNSGNLFSGEFCRSDSILNRCSSMRSIGVQKYTTNSRSASTETGNDDSEVSSPGYFFLRSRKKRNKHCPKVPTPQSMLDSPIGNHKFPTKPRLPPVPSDNWGSVALVPGSSRPKENNKSSLSPTPSDAFPDGNFDSLLEVIDEAVVSEWLESANASLADISAWCRKGENFVRFVHHWLSEIDEKNKVEIFSIEHNFLMSQLAFAFSASKMATSHLATLLAAVLREYPTKLVGSKGDRLFIEYLDILTSDRRDDSYRLMLSDVKCATVVRRYAQYILAIRSYALVSMWTAALNCYRMLHKDSKSAEPSAVAKANLSQERMYQAVRCGFIDVVQYFLQSGKLSPKMRDTNNKSLVFYAVINNQPEVLEFLLTRVQRSVDVNEPADSGNTPLHAAANVGSSMLVGILLLATNIDIDAQNTHCDDATPLHLAVMHGHVKVVRQLLSAGANPLLKMGSMAAIDIAKSFNHDDIVGILEKHSPSTSSTCHGHSSLLST